ncbi:MAG: immunoglobulin domain-containing protein, partial [Verrucomicrobia bacterium]|nr:immunoglobulin domain-containing protein [Verrucomicrobiota bacterium]
MPDQERRHATETMGRQSPPATLMQAGTPCSHPRVRLRVAVLILALLVIQAPNLAWAQGTVLFNTHSGGVNAPVRDTDGTTLLAGNAFRAQLYAGPQGSTESALQAVGVPVAFLTGTSAGYVNGGTVTVTGIAAGANAAIQMRVWETAYGTTYEQALAAGSKTGRSTILTLTLGGGGSPPTPAASLTGLQPFSLTGGSSQNQPPTITSQPQSRMNLVGDTATFSVTATGTAPLSYQWRKYDWALANGGNVSGATSSSLSLANVQPVDAADYQVVIANAAGAVTSTVATLTILWTNDYFNGFDSASASLSWKAWWGPPLPTLSWDAATDAAANPASGSLKLVEPFLGAAGEQFMTLFNFGGRWPWDPGLILDGRTYSNLVFDLRVAPGTALSIGGNYGPLELGFTGLPIDWPTTVSLGTFIIPRTATNWTHVVVPINSSSTNLNTISGVYFKMWSD